MCVKLCEYSTDAVQMWKLKRKSRDTLCYSITESIHTSSLMKHMCCVSECVLMPKHLFY